MTNRHSVIFHARGYELDENGNLHHAVMVQWFQDAAFHASAAVGYDADAYAASGSAWVVRELDVEFVADARYDDEVVVSTWISDMRRVRSHRECVARRARDNALLARQRVDWVYLDRVTGAPRRIPPDIAARFNSFGEPALTDFVLPNFSADGARRFESARRVQHHEIDEMHIVNHANYVNWLEQNMRDATAKSAKGTRNVTRHFFEFLQPARESDEIVVRSEMFEMEGAAFWTHQIKRGDAVLVKARTRTALTADR